MTNEDAVRLIEDYAHRISSDIEEGWGFFLQVYEIGNPEKRANYTFGVGTKRDQTPTP